MMSQNDAEDEVDSYDQSTMENNSTQHVEMDQTTSNLNSFIDVSISGNMNESDTKRTDVEMTVNQGLHDQTEDLGQRSDKGSPDLHDQPEDSDQRSDKGRPGLSDQTESTTTYQLYSREDKFVEKMHQSIQESSGGQRSDSDDQPIVYMDVADQDGKEDQQNVIRPSENLYENNHSKQDGYYKDHNDSMVITTCDHDDELGFIKTTKDKDLRNEHLSSADHTDKSDNISAMVEESTCDENKMAADYDLISSENDIYGSNVTKLQEDSQTKDSESVTRKHDDITLQSNATNIGSKSNGSKVSYQKEFCATEMNDFVRKEGNEVLGNPLNDSVKISSIQIAKNSEVTTSPESEKISQDEDFNITEENHSGKLDKADVEMCDVDKDVMKQVDMPKYNSMIFDVSEDSESDRSPRLVIAMPESSESECTVSPISKKIDKGLETLRSILNKNIVNEIIEHKDGSGVTDKGANSEDKASSDKSREQIDQLVIDSDRTSEQNKQQGVSGTCSDKTSKHIDQEGVCNDNNSEQTDQHGVDIDSDKTSELIEQPRVGTDSAKTSEQLDQQGMDSDKNSEKIDRPIFESEKRRKQIDQQKVTTSGRIVSSVDRKTDNSFKTVNKTQKGTKTKNNSVASVIDKVVVKREPVEHMEESGDILDILNSQNTRNSVVVTDTSIVTNKVNVNYQSTESGTDDNVRIKSEPVDESYELYQSYYSNSEARNVPAHGVLSVQTTGILSETSSSSSSLSRLSKQVANLKPSNSINKGNQPLGYSILQQTKTSSGNPINAADKMIVKIPNPNIIDKTNNSKSTIFHAPGRIDHNSTQCATSVSFSRMPVILQPATGVQNKGTFSMVSVPVSHESNKFTKLQISRPSGTKGFVINYSSSTASTSSDQKTSVNGKADSTSTTSTGKVCVSVIGNKDNLSAQPEISKVFPAQKVSTPVQSVISLPKTSSVISVQKVSTPALLQTNVKVSQTDLPVTSINIDTVGLAKITELIARKNPIPNYKPPPVPDNLKSVYGKVPNTYVCYECGDTYTLLDSLLQHRGRYSMKIVFRCDDCNAEKTFFNKCQFLSHLRGHLNIEKTQAVPIHIKSDSITISTLPDSYQKLMFNQRPSNVIFKDVEATKRCRECGLLLPTEKLLEHYGKGKTISEKTFTCGQCHMRLPTSCALRAHRRFHRGFLPSLCPECGCESFFDPEDKCIKPTWHANELFSYHLRDVCFHLSRSSVIVCQKCGYDSENADIFKNHLMEKLEQYFKCQACPMAFKSQETFRKHFIGHNMNSKQPQFKIIYRCHICDSVMDDKGVLEIHTSHHVAEAKAMFKFKCLCCGDFFGEKEELAAHFQKKHASYKGGRLCFLCRRSFPSIQKSVEHYFSEHLPVRYKSDIYRACSTCGMMLKSTDLMSHLQVCVANTGVKNFDCNICFKRSNSHAGHIAHLRKHKNMGHLLCVPCGETNFTNYDQLKEHEKKCTKVNQLLETKQSKSPSKSPSKTLLKSPSRSNVNFHTNVGVHPCTSENCTKSFVTLEELNQHRKNDHGLNLLFPCHLCGLTYEFQSSLTKHIKIIHEGKRRVYPCWVCRSRKIKKVFSAKALLEKHLTSRHRIPKDQLDESQFVREYDDSVEKDLGGRNFQENLKRKANACEPDSPVKRLHLDGENTFNCAKCIYSSEDRTVFLEHILTHKIDKYVQCLECGLSFAVLPSLRKHLFMVHKIKDFDSYCQESGIEQIREEMLSDDDLIVTVTSDDSEQTQQETEDDDRNPLECRVCHKIFDSESNVRAHIRTHGMAFIRSKRQAAKMASTKSNVVNGNESSDSSHCTSPLS